MGAVRTRIAPPNSASPHSRPHQRNSRNGPSLMAGVRPGAADQALAIRGEAARAQDNAHELRTATEAGFAANREWCRSRAAPLHVGSQPGLWSYSSRARFFFELCC